jgi:hypothetical protein
MFRSESRIPEGRKKAEIRSPKNEPRASIRVSAFAVSFCDSL